MAIVTIKSSTRPALEEAAESVETMAVAIFDLAESSTFNYSRMMVLLSPWPLLAGVREVLFRCSPAALVDHSDCSLYWSQ